MTRKLSKRQAEVLKKLQAGWKMGQHSGNFNQSAWIYEVAERLTPLTETVGTATVRVLKDCGFITFHYSYPISTYELTDAGRKKQEDETPIGRDYKQFFEAGSLLEIEGTDDRYPRILPRDEFEKIVAEMFRDHQGYTQHSGLGEVFSGRVADLVYGEDSEDSDG